MFPPLRKDPPRGRECRGLAHVTFRLFPIHFPLLRKHRDGCSGLLHNTKEGVNQGSDGLVFQPAGRLGSPIQVLRLPGGGDGDRAAPMGRPVRQPPRRPLPHRCLCRGAPRPRRRPASGDEMYVLPRGLSR